MPRVLPRAVVRRTLATIATALCLGGGVATTPGPAHAAAPPPRWEYTVRVAPDLASIHVRLCFRDFVPRRLWLADASPLTFVRLLGSTGMTLAVDPTQDGTLVASGVTGDACFEYAVDVAPLVEAGVCDRCGADVITRPGSWLFRAGFLPRDLEATVRFELPPGSRWRPPGRTSARPTRIASTPRRGRSSDTSPSGTSPSTDSWPRDAPSSWPASTARWPRRRRGSGGGSRLRWRPTRTSTAGASPSRGCW